MPRTQKNKTHSHERKTMSKIIQILKIRVEEDKPESLIALCEDGTLWETYWDSAKGDWKEWLQIRSLPKKGEFNLSFR